MSSSGSHRTQGYQIGSFWLPQAALRFLQISFCWGALSVPALAQRDHSVAQITPAPIEVDAGEDLQLTAENGRRAQARALYFRGIQEEQAADIPAAIISYQAALDADPTNAELAEKTMHLLAQYGRGGEAKVMLDGLLAQNDDSPEITIVLSRYYSIYDRDNDGVANGLKLAEQAVERFPHNATVLRNQIDLLLSAGKRPASEAAVEKALERGSPKASHWLEMGHIAKKIWPINQPAQRKANLSKINTIYEKALKRAAGDVDVRSQVAGYFAYTSQWDRARDLYEEVLDERPDLLDIRYRLAKIYGVLKMPDEHLAALEKLGQIDAYDGEVQIELAESLDDRAIGLAKGGDRGAAYAEWEKAIDAYSKSLDLGAGDLSDYLRLGDLLLIVRDSGEDAVQLAQKLTIRFPDSPHVIAFHARALIELERYDAALEAFALAEPMAEKRAPTLLSDRFYFSYAVAHERQQQFAEAMKMFKKSLELVRDDDPDLGANTYNYLGYMMLEQGIEVEEAGGYIERANELSPGNPAYADSLGWYYFKVGRFEEALKALLDSETFMEEADKGDPSNAVIFDHIGQAFEKVGKPADALRYYQRAASLDPQNAEIVERHTTFKNSSPNQAPAQVEDTAAP